MRGEFAISEPAEQEASSVFDRGEAGVVGVHGRVAGGRDGSFPEGAPCDSGPDLTGGIGSEAGDKTDLV